LIVFRKNQIDYPEPQSLLEQPTHTELAHETHRKFIGHRSHALPWQLNTRVALVAGLNPTPLQNVEEVELRKSYRISRSTILSDHVVYLPESDVDIGHKDDPNLFSHAMNGENSALRFSAMK
jgi:hypothetical protein